MDVVLLGRLGGQHEGLHEPAHRLTVVGELAAHLEGTAVSSVITKGSRPFSFDYLKNYV